MGSYQPSQEPFRFTAGSGTRNNDYNSYFPRSAANPPHPSGNSAMTGQSNGSAQQERLTFLDDSQNDGDAPPAPMTGDPNFDILDWFPAYQSCQRYFLDHAQHEPGTQALCALVNIRLPFQWLATPITSSAPQQQQSQAQQQQQPQQVPTPSAQQPYQFNPFNTASRQTPSNNTFLPTPTTRSRATSDNNASPTFVSLVPYIRRLVITGFDKTAILHGFFGDDYRRGVLPHVDCERRNYLFAAKHGGWRSCKKQYDNGSGGGGDETVPFMKPLDEARTEELAAAEKAWSRWLAMEDWMVGPRAPPEEMDSAGAGMDGGGRGSRQMQHEERGVEDGYNAEYAVGSHLFGGT